MNTTDSMVEIKKNLSDIDVYLRLFVMKKRKSKRLARQTIVLLLRSEVIIKKELDRRIREF